MKKINVAESMLLVGEKNFGGKERMIDYYLVGKNSRKLYAFTKKYTDKTYEICKSGVRLNKLISTKTRNEGVMKLVRYTARMMPYLAEYYSLNNVA